MTQDFCIREFFFWGGVQLFKDRNLGIFKVISLI